MSPAIVQLVLTLQAIQHGGIAKPGAIRKIVDRLSQRLLADRVFDPAAFANQKLALIAGQEAASSRGRFIQELYTSESKERRLELVDLLSRAADPSLAEELVRLAGTNPPWYVARNIISILSSLTPAPPERYLLSYLDFPDQRIQRQVIEAVGKRGGDTTRDKWLLALHSCDNEIKLQIIPKLAATGGADVETVFTGMLRDWRRLDGNRQEEVLETVVTELGNYPSIRVVFAIESFIRERSSQHGSGDRLTEVARDTLKSLWSG
jgi:HEAT repeat protein